METADIKILELITEWFSLLPSFCELLLITKEFSLPFCSLFLHNFIIFYRRKQFFSLFSLSLARIVISVGRHNDLACRGTRQKLRRSSSIQYHLIIMRDIYSAPWQRSAQRCEKLNDAAHFFCITRNGTTTQCVCRRRRPKDF
jgi:hypothetical protein